MRWPPFHISVLFILLPFTFFGGRAVLRAALSEGSGPYDNDAQIRFTTVRRWAGSGYSRMPRYAGGGVWHSWDDGYWAYKNSIFSYCVWDEPYWPEGHPGLGANNPLPPLVKRVHIYGVSPILVLISLAVGWCCWPVMYVVYWRRHHRAGPGFDLSASPGPSAGLGGDPKP